MKSVSLLLCIMAWVVSSSHAQTDYRQWECGYSHVKPINAEAYEKGITAHNKKFHTADPYKVAVFQVLTGPHSGGYFVALGPVTWTQIEGRPSSAEHDMDWMQHVAPFVETEGETQYWRIDDEILYRAPNSANFSRSRLRNFTLLPGQEDRFIALIKQFVAVYKAKAYPASYFMYKRFGASQGPHIISEISMDQWSHFDRPDTFEKDFDEVHGAGAYNRFIAEFELCVDRSKTYDELIVFKPELSSNF